MGRRRSHPQRNYTRILRGISSDGFHAADRPRRIADDDYCKKYRFDKVR